MNAHASKPAAVDVGLFRLLSPHDIASPSDIDAVCLPVSLAVSRRDRRTDSPENVDIAQSGG